MRSTYQPLSSTFRRPSAPWGLFAALLAAACAHQGARSETVGALEKGGLGLDKGEVITVAASEEAVGRAFAGRRHALLIGINEVEDERWRTLRFAWKDAVDLSAVLRDPARGGYDTVTVLTSKEETTKERLEAAIRELAARASRPEDVVVLYVSAHGTLARDGTGSLKRYLVTSDADYGHISETALGVEALSGLLKASGSRRRVLFLATCHSGSGKSLVSAEVEAELASLKGPSLVRPLEEASRASIVFSASDWGETAREDETLQNDVYTHFLIEALGGPGDRNGDGAVTATEAHDFARRRTWVFSQGRQRPSAEIVEVGADPVILSGRLQRSGQPELYSYAPRLDGFTLVVDGEERVELPGGAALRAGGHRVELTKGDSVLLREELQLELGQRVDLEDLVRRHEPTNSVAIIAGGFSFIDATSRSELLPGGPSLGVSIRSDRLFLKRISVEADVSGFGGLSELSIDRGAPIPVAWGSLLVGASALVAWDWRWVSLWAGPRVAALWIHRSFNLEAYAKSQSAWSVTPGVMVGGAVRLSSRVELTLNVQTMLTVLSVDGQTRFLGYAGGFAGVGYRY